MGLNNRHDRRPFDRKVSMDERHLAAVIDQKWWSSNNVDTICRWFGDRVDIFAHLEEIGLNPIVDRAHVRFLLAEKN
jgi:hypothetical protein